MWSSSPRKRCRSPRRGAWPTSPGRCLAPSRSRAIPAACSFPVIAAPGPPGPSSSDTGLTLRIPVGARSVEGYVHESRLPGSDVAVYLIDQPRYFDRDGLYGAGGKDYDDNCERFVFFNRAVLETIQALRLRPDVIHCNDWQTGLIPVYLKTLYQHVPELASAGTLLTIHNLAYLGLFWHWDMALTGLDWHLFNWRQLEFHGKLCFMKAGLVFADMLSTVSPTYAREIQTPRFGSGLDGLLRDRQADLRGIVNGIDTEAWSPSHEPMLAGALRRGERRARARPGARPGSSGRRASPSVPTSRCSRRSAGSTPRRAGTCWPRWPTGCWSGTFSWWFWVRDIPSTTPCSRTSRGGMPASSGRISASPTTWPTRSRPAPIFS